MKSHYSLNALSVLPVTIKFFLKAVVMWWHVTSREDAAAVIWELEEVKASWIVSY